jgi:hypothetical protein
MHNLTGKERISVRKMLGKFYDEYRIYLSCANDGCGGDITRNREPLLSFEEWLKS